MDKKTGPALMLPMDAIVNLEDVGQQHKDTTHMLGLEKLDRQTARWANKPAPWYFSPRQLALRLFLTCWIVYSLHFASNTVREIYLALAIGDHLSFRVDEYAHMHPDLFEKEGYGWHIGNNPGASMVAAIPYALSRPILDRIVESVNRSRAASGMAAPTYESPWPMAREFFQEAWRRGYDIKFGLGAFVMQSLAMAPSSALAVVGMFYVLRHLFVSDKKATALALLYAFGTPVFFRTGYLNQNMMLGHIAFLGFAVLWNPGGRLRWPARWRFVLAGLAGGTSLLFDYSGLVFLAGLLLYGLAKSLPDTSRRGLARLSVWYVLGAVGPVLLLWFYQWQSFGNPFLPGQNWMPPVEWSDMGYQGFGLPQPELLAMLAFDYRFGLFVSSPLMILALAAPFLNRSSERRLPSIELVTILVLFVGLWVFFSGSNYTRLQFNTGVRYLAPIFPFLFIPAVVVLERLPRIAVYFVVLASLTLSWCLAMYRDVELGPGVLAPVLRTFTEGFQLPTLERLSLLGNTYGDYFAHGVSPLPLLVLTAAILVGLWMPLRRVDGEQPITSP